MNADQYGKKQDRDGTRRSTVPTSERDPIDRWSSVPDQPPTRSDTPTAPNRPRLYGRRLRQHAEETR